MDKQNRAARKKHHVIYKTTCLVTGRYYIGMHSTDDLADGYIGSGKRLWQSIRKHGADQHRCEVLEHLPSRETLRLREAELVNKQLLTDKQCMNLTLGGDGGWEHCNSNSEMQRSKVQRWNEKRKLIELVNPGWCSRSSKKAAVTRKARGWKPSLMPSWKGRKHRTETKQKISLAHKSVGHAVGDKNPMAGMITVYHEELMQVKKVKSAELAEHEQQGWKKGAIFNWEKHQHLQTCKQQEREALQAKIDLLSQVDFSKPGWGHEVQRLLSMKSYNAAKSFVRLKLPQVYIAAYVDIKMRRNCPDS